MTSEERSLVPAREPPHRDERLVALAPVSEQLASLTKLDEDNRVGEGQRGLALRVRLGGILGGGGLFIAGAAAALPVLQTGGLVVAALAFGGGMFLERRGRKLDLDDRKLHTARYVLEGLREELSPDEPVRLSLDFEGYDRTPPLSGERALPAGPDKLFEKRWLELEIALEDARVEVLATAQVQRSSRQEPRYTKLKDEVVDDVIVTVRSRGKAQAAESAVQEAAARFDGGPGLTLVRTTLNDGYAELHFRLGPGHWRRFRYGWHPDENTRSLLDGYKLLELIRVSRAIARGEASDLAS